MAEVNKNSQEVGPKNPWENRQYDPKAVMFDYTALDGQVYSIDWSWYMTIPDRFEALAALTKSIRTTIWTSFNKLQAAILGNRSIKQVASEDRAFMGATVARSDPSPEKYNKGSFRGPGFYDKNPVVGGEFKRFFASASEFLAHVQDIEDKKWVKTEVPQKKANETETA